MNASSSPPARDRGEDAAAYTPESLLAADFLEAFERFSRHVLAGPNDYGYDLDDDEELRRVRERLFDLAIDVHEIEVRHAHKA